MSAAIYLSISKQTHQGLVHQSKLTRRSSKYSVSGTTSPSLAQQKSLGRICNCSVSGFSLVRKDV